MGRHLRRSRIYLNERWMRDPLDVIELGTHLPILHRFKVIWDYLFRPRSLPDDSFENYVLRRYGRSLYRLFFQAYTEKLFGVPGNEISVSWARQKVRLANPIDHYRENTKTKFQYFYYPIRGGYGAIANRLYEEVKDHVLLQTTVTGFEQDAGAIRGVQYQQDGQNHLLEVEHVVSTLPLTLTGRLLGYELFMNYRKVDAVYLLVDRPLVTDNHWTYYIDSQICINRMVEFKNMSAVDTPAATTVLCAEVTQDHPNVVAKVIDDLEKVHLISRSAILDTKVIREKFAYPVYDQVYDRTIETAQDNLSKINNLHLVGRAAEFRHREVDDNFAAALETARLIAGKYQKAEIILSKEEEKMTGKQQIYAVILTYNHYEDTHECLQSLLEAAGAEIQIVLVDNGSSDGTPARVRQDFPQVHILENGQNLGVPAGYNVGFAYALDMGADYILMLNNDTVLAPDMLKELMVVAESDPKAGLVMPKVLVHGSNEKIWSSGGRYRIFPPAILMTDTRKGLENKTRLIEYAPSCALLIHRRAFDQAGLFDPGYFFLYDDWDFSERVRAHGLNIWYAPNARIWHKVSTTTQGPQSPFFWRTFGASIARFYRRHGRPVWFALPVHIGYVILREFFWKRNWAYWPDFWQGILEGLQRPLGNLPAGMSTRSPDPVHRA